VVRLLTNPMVLRAAFVLVASGGAFFFAIWIIRSLRRNIVAEASLDASAPSTLEGLPFHLYNTVIQQLKQQKHELQVQTLAEQRRARTTENFSQTVLSNLPSGVLVFDVNGLVKQANPAAKAILGFSSLSGMSTEDIFRGAIVCSSQDSQISDEVNAVLREASNSRQVEAEYSTPAGEERRVAITVFPVPAVGGGLLGAACLISDRSEFEKIRHQQLLQGEISAEMALDLRTSLNTIASHARLLSHNCEPKLILQLADDIASEAARLDRHIGGFLAAKRNADETLVRAATP
jgi:two-component system, NtrC family, sensor histidine kinase PilS